jgi:hypothetical protein
MRSAKAKHVEQNEKFNHSDRKSEMEETVGSIEM